MGGIGFLHPAQLTKATLLRVSLLIRVFQSASAVRVPGPWLAPPHNETLCVIAMRVSNPDRLPVGINR
jgi:hypothetical protein